MRLWVAEWRAFLILSQADYLTGRPRPLFHVRWSSEIRTNHRLRWLHAGCAAIDTKPSQITSVPHQQALGRRFCSILLRQLVEPKA